MVGGSPKFVNFFFNKIVALSTVVTSPHLTI